MRKVCLALALAILVGISSRILISTAQAGEIDILVEKLVEKGILTHGEAQQILTETKEEVRKELAKGTSESVPSWVQRLKWKGDLRLRYQFEDKRHDSTTGRHRQRLRGRLGLEAKVNDKVNVYAGLATSGFGTKHDGSEDYRDPRSRNVTFDNTFETKMLDLDYMYAKYSPFSWVSLFGGKIVRKNIL